MIQIFFALLAGILTVGAPCILPLLPILLGASVGQTSRTRPLFIALGFITMFSLAGLTLSFIVTSLMVPPDILRNIAIAALAVFGLLMIFPKPFELLAQYLSGYITKAQGVSQKAGSGNFGGFVLGVILGLIWTPCAGPVLGSILTLIATQTNVAQAGVLLVAYAIGAGLPMLAIAYGGQFVTTRIKTLFRYTAALQKIFGVLIIALAAAMYFQYDLKFQAKILEYYNFPSLEEKLLKPKIMDGQGGQEAINKNAADGETLIMKLPDYGPAPEFTGISNWLNSEPLAMEALRGKVVLVDFWTYSCINCIRTFPFTAAWHEKYKDQGFVLVGVHTPEFEFEKVTANVQTALKRHNILYPVAQDNDFGTWRAYNNRYWPAHYLIDKEGNVRYYHFGEGKYEETENAIKFLLGLPGPVSASGQKTPGPVLTPEIYFGTARLEYLADSQKPAAMAADFSFPQKLDDNHFALEGRWQFGPENVKLAEGAGKIKMKFNAGKIHMVAQSGQAVAVAITVDGKSAGSVTIGPSDLYTLFDSEDYREHEIIIDIPGPGLEAFTFTFG